MKKGYLLLFGLCAIGLCSWKVQSINLQATSISINIA